MKVFALSAFASVTCTLCLALVVWIDAAAQAVNPYAAATQREAEQAYQTGRFPELKGLTNSQEDQLKALKLCENYRGADGRICGEVVGVYMKQGDDAAKSKKQADDDVWIQSLVQNLSDTETSLYKRCMESFDQGNKADYASHCANRAKETIKSQEAAAAAEKERLARIAGVRAGLATDSERKLFDSCIDSRGKTAMPSSCADSARNQCAAQIKEDAMRSCSNSKAHQLWEITSAITVMNMNIKSAQNNLDRDRKVERIGGVVNLTLREEAGRVLVDVPSLRDKAFAEYKNLNGTIGSAEKIIPVDDPCDSLK